MALLPLCGTTKEAGTGLRTQSPAPSTQKPALPYPVEYVFSICFFTAACAAASRAMGTR
jgi:hypothetical protein